MLFLLRRHLRIKSSIVFTLLLIPFFILTYWGGCSSSSGWETLPRQLHRAYAHALETGHISAADTVLLVSTREQKLYLVRDSEVKNSWPVSTSSHGLGNREGSNRTPPGTHAVAAKIGAGAPEGTIFRGRHNTGEIATIWKDKRDAAADLVLTRIIRLRGLEPGINEGGEVDSFRRNIYIHGTNEEGLISTPSSHGCIRMRNRDVIELFDLVSENTVVEIF